MASKKRLGEVLRERGKISAEELHKAIAEQEGKVLMLGELLLSRGSLSKDDLIGALEEVTHVGYLDCREFAPTPEALELVPRETALKYNVLPYESDENKLIVVMAEPQNLRTIDELRFLTGKVISPRLGFRDEIATSIEKYYAGMAAEEADAAASIESRELGDDPLADAESSEIEFISVSSRESAREAMAEFQAELSNRRTPAVRLVSTIISRAAARKASDIHIEPMSQGTIVRIRVDGVLRELLQVKGKLQSSLVSRIKVLSDMDIAERRAPQDGRFMVNLAGRKIDLRVSTLPTNHGEKVVMRLLEASSPLASFNEMGFDGEVIAQLKRLLIQPQGMLLVTGPTGSGKSTTLYSALNFLRAPGVNIVTVEDPIEYMIDGINQVQVHPKAGLTFSNALRSILRQDPNIIMIGEIRDTETAEIALKASQTGHMVLSTLHTNDAVSAIVRLLDLGIPGYLIASSLTGIVAQRLVRKLCKCKSASVASPELVARLVAHGVDDSQLTTFAPVGCRECDHSGYRGRVGVYEVLTLDEPMRRAIRSGAPVEQIRQLASIAGTRWIQEDGLEKVRRGMTTFDEILRVVAFDDSKPEICQRCNRELAPAFLYCPYCSARRVAVAPTGHPTHVPHLPPGVAPAVAELVTAGASSGHELQLQRARISNSAHSTDAHAADGHAADLNGSQPQQTAYLRRNLRQSDRSGDPLTPEQIRAARRTDTPIHEDPDADAGVHPNSPSSSTSPAPSASNVNIVTRQYKSPRR